MRSIILYTLYFSMILWIAGNLSYAQNYDRLNPPYPRTAIYSTSEGGGWPRYSIGSRLEKLKKYDMVYIYGTVDQLGHIVASELRKHNPNQILIAMALNGLYFYDPPEIFLYRSYRGKLKNRIVPGQREIIVDSVDGIDAGLTNTRFLYAVINNDVIDIEAIANDTVLVVEDDTSNFYAIDKVHEAGSIVMSPIRSSGPGVFPNFSEWCPMVNGKYSWDYLAEKNLLRKIDWKLKLFDGLFHDFFHPTLYISDHTLDMNLNGVDDYEEHSPNWINNHWREYLGRWIDKEMELMQQLAPDMPNLFGVNAGGTMDEFIDKMHGHCFEGFMRWVSDWEVYLADDCLKWMEQGRKPSIMFIEDYIPEKWSHDGKNRFTKMRFGLTTALMFDCYYGMTFGDWYYMMIWYDEFETNLGYPTQMPQKMPNGLWIRYFDNGVAVCNPTGAPQKLEAASLVGGPYYRLRGGQDPVFNNGEIFSGTLELYGHKYNEQDLRGDGILLFKEPTTVVSDIIIDNFFNNDTSPGSKPVELTNGWKRYVSRGDEILENNNPYWSQMGDKTRVGDFDEAYGYHAVPAGLGEETATWRPTIGVPGYYEISEWHGWHGDYPQSYDEATNIPFKIVVQDRIILTGTINQRENPGQWNRLCYTYLPAGENSFVEITNKADGWIIADAVQFRFLGDNVNPDAVPPKPPENIKIH